MLLQYEKNNSQTQTESSKLQLIQLCVKKKIHVSHKIAASSLCEGKTTLFSPKSCLKFETKFIHFPTKIFPPVD